MLSELRVRDLAVIADVTLPLRAGLNVLSGETGAGKSLLVDALALLLGERASVDVVRPGAEKTVIEGAFELSSTALDRLRPSLSALGVEVGEGLLVLKREIHREGRSRAWASGSPTTVGVLAQLGALLVDLHGQHETQSLLQPDAQRDMLDAFAGAAVERVAVADAHGRWQALERRETELRAKQDEVRRKADYLRHVAGEIERAAPRIGEDEALAAEARRLAHADELGRLGRELEQAVDATGLTRARKLVAALERLDPAVGRWQELVDGASANLEELAAAAREYVAGVEADPARLGEIEQRREVLYRLQQKHGPTIPDVLAARDAAARELELLDTADFDLRAIGEQRAAARADFDRAVAALTARRGAAAGRLAAAVDELLPELGMPAGRFVVDLSPLPAPRADGGETVGFVIQLNPGLEPRPLARVASGGELSRLMLALKVVLARHDAVPTLVFDEVDQGIGGEVGSQVGEALTRVAGTDPGRKPGERQVFVITHLPQIAARADHHIVVAKGAKGGVATSDVTVATGDARRRELARMLGDPDMATALRHAEELLRTASATPAAPPETRSRPGAGRSPRTR